jgi:hypothetical protein
MSSIRLPSFPLAQQAQISASRNIISRARAPFFSHLVAERSLDCSSRAPEGPNSRVFTERADGEHPAFVVRYAAPPLNRSAKFFHIYNRRWPRLRAGTRWLTRFDKEVELSIRLIYQALTTGRGRSPTLPPSQSIPLAIIESEILL